jgi:hypothetical protein
VGIEDKWTRNAGFVRGGDHGPDNYLDLINEENQIIQMLRAGKEHEEVRWATTYAAEMEVKTTVGEVRELLLLGASIDEFLLLPVQRRIVRYRKVTTELVRRHGAIMSDLAARKARTELHNRLRSWAHGDLQVERPQGSSFHHFVNYNAGLRGEFENMNSQALQQIVVEHNWGASNPPIHGEWRLPFESICWEFRISGVRILAFTDHQTGVFDGEPSMWCIYGKDGHWVVDDYFYPLGQDMELPAGKAHRIRDGVVVNTKDSFEFRPVASTVYRCIRAICIMMDAAVVEHQHVMARDHRQQSRTGKTTQRDHYVVRLLNHEHRSYSTRTAHTAIGSGVKQRGHWRKGTWVHYDDQDSGQVQYTNDGGFIVSKSWRKWHFAGDPNNILHKEYRA